MDMMDDPLPPPPPRLWARIPWADVGYEGQESYGGQEGYDRQAGPAWAGVAPRSPLSGLHRESNFFAPAQALIDGLGTHKPK
jgi:hypothetical protein